MIKFLNIILKTVGKQAVKFPLSNFSITPGNYVIPRAARDLLKSGTVPAFGDSSLLSG
jgi:hypothetical protein